MEERATVRLEDMREIAAFARLNHRRKEVLAELADAEVRRFSLAAAAKPPRRRAPQRESAAQPTHPHPSYTLSPRRSASSIGRTRRMR